MTPNPTTAADLASVLGTVKQQVDSYNTERKQLADSLRQIVSSAQQLLGELGEAVEVGTAARGRRRGRPPGRRNQAAAAATGEKRGPGRPKGSGKGKRRKMSAETRAKMRAAAKKRWAERKASEKK